MPYVTANGIRIHYERTGGGGPPLVLLHGITDSGRCWPRLTTALRDRYDLISLDARAHGLSDAPETGYSWNIMADDVAAVIQELGLSRPGLIGHSMGAATAALVAAHYPDRVGRLVLEDPPFRDPLPTPQEQAATIDTWRSSIVDRKNMTVEQMIEYSAKTNPGVRRWDVVEFGPWSEAKKRVSLNIIQLVQSPWPQWKDVVARIVCPALLIVADVARGAIVTPDVARQITQINPHITVVTIPDAGHNIRRENFPAYLSAVSEFLKATDGQRA